MYERAHVFQARAKAALNAAAEPKLAPFFQSVQDATGACWRRSSSSFETSIRGIRNAC